ncbi:MAG: hypothetical protein ISS71_00815 [Phycisphaerae bacterium]|nr:hypothetical protein [Phycisphaerae bacterium]
MKYPVTKYAAAAIVILAVLVGINWITGSIDGASVAWAQVVEQLNHHEKYKCRQRVVREEGPQQPTMNVYHMNLSLRRQEVEDGSIHIIDMRGTDAITIELYPDQKKAVVTKLLGFGPKKDPDIIDMVKQFEQESTEKLGTKKQDGKILQGFRHQPNANNDFTVWVDPETKLPVEIELKHLIDGQLRQTIFLDEFEFDFDLEPSAFSTDIPDGYAIETITQDYRPFEPTEIAPENVQKNLSHTAYTVITLPWMNQICAIETIDPLGSRAKVYMTGIHVDDGNVIVIVQGDYYDMNRMVWIPQQQLLLETDNDIKLYSHPNGAIYAEHFLTSLAQASPAFFDAKNLSEERFTAMIVMPNGVVLSLSANKKMSLDRLKELAESFAEIDAGQ